MELHLQIGLMSMQRRKITLEAIFDDSTYLEVPGRTFFFPLPLLFFIFLSTVGSWYLTKSTVICKGVVPSSTSQQCREERRKNMKKCYGAVYYVGFPVKCIRIQFKRLK